MGCGKSSLPKDDVKDLEVAGPAPNPAANDSGKSDEDDAFFNDMLGPPVSVARAAAKPPDPLLAPSPAPARAPVAPAAGQGRAASSNGQADPAQPLSLKMQKHLLKNGLPPPSQEEDEKYGLLDDYVDDLLGTQAQDRPADWQRPDMADPKFQAALRGMTPQIIYGDGTKGPARLGTQAREMPTPGRMMETYTMPEEFAYKPPADAKPNVVTPLLDGVLTRWAKVDGNSVPVKKGDVVPVPAAKKRAQPP